MTPFSQQRQEEEEAVIGGGLMTADVASRTGAQTAMAQSHQGPLPLPLFTHRPLIGQRHLKVRV